MGGTPYAAVRALALATVWLGVSWSTAGPPADDSGAGDLVLAMSLALVALVWGSADGFWASAHAGEDDLVRAVVGWALTALVAAPVVAALAPTQEGHLDLTGVLDAGGLLAVLLLVLLPCACVGLGLGAAAHVAARRVPGLRR